MDHDVIVVGAGPGGSTAAYELARQGVRVGPFEKQPLPRLKPGGGCLSRPVYGRRATQVLHGHGTSAPMRAQRGCYRMTPPA
jgi:2-polyprenyl-6-methoxyphenol hydroxylase-like FAD-dependent oxidoreductase